MRNWNINKREREGRKVGREGGREGETETEISKTLIAENKARIQVFKKAG